MNTAVAPGKSCDGMDGWRVMTGKGTVVAYGPAMRDSLAEYFYRQYVEGSDARWSEKAFKRLVADGHIICMALEHEGELVATFGLELMHDAAGPYGSFCWYRGRLPALWLLGRVVMAMFVGTKSWQDACREKGPARFYLVGRPGWRRVLKLLGIRISDGGWIFEDQEAFRDGRFWR